MACFCIGQFFVIEVVEEVVLEILCTDHWFNLAV